jgi:peroxiredoxin
MLAEDLASLHAPLKEKNTEVVLVGYGDAESNRKLAAEHGLKCTILLLENSSAQEFELFKHRGTPSAYLLDEQGRVAQPLAVGRDDVLELARQAAGGDGVKKGGLRKLPLSESRIERDGLKAGTPAPAFSLPDIHGGTVSLDQFHGRKVLLVFSDPQCGPCDQLAPELARLHRKHADNGLAFVMVGRGDREQNKKKAMEHGIAFPVALQEKWKLSRQYGIFATPVAFLIGKDGVIARNVAQGSDQITTLAQEALASN